MAIKALTWMVRVFEPPVYCYHEIVHNKVVVDRFEQMGVVFVASVDEVPPGAPLMLSAHGSAPSVVASARQRGGAVVDAVCPLVTKVHHELKVRAGRGYTVVYVGHRNHDEAVGTMAVAPEAVRLVQSEADVAEIDVVEGPVAFLAQTTLSLDEWRGILAATESRFPDMWVPGRADLCFATTNRQAALRAIADRAETVVVIGSANSSNTAALEKVAIGSGCPRVLRVNGADELPDDLHGVVGLTAGASAPEDLVRAVVDRLGPRDGVEIVTITEEEEYFPPPRELRELLRAVASAVSVSLLAPVAANAASVLTDDRAVQAADALGAVAC
jgi:4-hydroxy-3-methylbut-2-enyl diphosphate reductase